LQAHFAWQDLLHGVDGLVFLALLGLAFVAMSLPFVSEGQRGTPGCEKQFTKYCYNMSTLFREKNEKSSIGLIAKKKNLYGGIF
jgi:hypothetical protein